ncbi:MAG: RNA polymerase sigma factor RpoD, partial [Clostridia bacterium]|nr:RNA polymerase sigma factor RpoD [Clostridia bacterium]
MGIETADKKSAFRALVERGKQTGKLTTREIDAAIEEMNLELEELDELYDTIETQNIKIIDDLGDAALEELTFDTDVKVAGD